MSNKESKLKRIEEIEKELQKLKEDIKKEDIVLKRRRVDVGNDYHVVYGSGKLDLCEENYRFIDDDYFSIGNYFHTKEDAELYKEQLIVTQMLRDIALELNNGVEIDWSSSKQNKYSVYLDMSTGNICDKSNLNWKTSDIFCVCNTFKNIIIERIGSERLINYFKNYR